MNLVLFVIAFIFLALLIFRLLRSKRNAAGRRKRPKPAPKKFEIIQKQPDLHTGGVDYSTHLYSEISFYAPFGEVFNLPGTADDIRGNFNGHELIDLAHALNIPINRDYVVEQYLNEENRNVEVFHSDIDEQVFMYLDLEWEETDQLGAFFIGVRFNKKDFETVNLALQDIHKRFRTIYTQYFVERDGLVLYNKVFKSFEYFYHGNYNTFMNMGRRLPENMHHYRETEYNRRKKEMTHHNIDVPVFSPK